MKIRGILETCLYAKNLDKAEQFYRSLPGIDFVAKEEDRHIFFSCGESMLLIFNPELTSIAEPNSESVPPHGATGEGHIAFSIDPGSIDKWREFFNKNYIEIESEITWPNGSVSLYFRDPAGNSLELVSPDIWD